MSVAKKETPQTTTNPNQLSEEQRAEVDQFTADFINRLEATDEDRLDPFQVNSLLNANLHAICGDQPEERRYTPEFQATTKHFLGNYIELVKVETKTNDPDQYQQALDLVTKFDRAVLGLSPSIVNGLNSYENMIETAAKALEVPELQGSLAARINGELNYQLSFDEGLSPDTIQDLAQGETTTETLNRISILEGVGKEAAVNSNWSQSALQAIQQGIKGLESSEIPLVSAFADAVGDSLIEQIREPHLGVLRFENDPRYGRDSQLNEAVIEEHKKLSEQLDIKEQLPLNTLLQQIAKDAVAVVDQGLVPHRVARISNNNSGEKVQFASLAEISKEDQLTQVSQAADAATALLLQRLHEPRLKSVIEDSLAVPLQEISLASQVQLLGFMAEANHKTYHRLEAALDNYAAENLQSRTEMLEAFLALEFGDDFGNILLDIAETLPPAKSERLFAGINIIRGRAHQLAEQLNVSEVPEMETFADAVELAVTKRLTELLTLATTEEQKRMFQTLDLLNLSLEHINTGLSNELEPNVITEDFGNFRSRVAPVSVSFRPESSDRGDARLSFSVRPDRNQIKEITGQEAPEDNRINLRVDLEETGLSLDIGTTNSQNQEQELSALVGEVVALGEAELAKRRGQDEAILNQNHVREAFPTELSDPNAFRRILNNVMYELKLPAAEAGH